MAELGQKAESADHTISVTDHVRRVGEIRINDPDNAALKVRLVTSGTKSPAFREVFDNLEAMRDAELAVSAIFTGVRSKKEAVEIFARYASVYGLEAANGNLRICLMRRRKEVSEQLLLGESAVWSQDAVAGPTTEKVAADIVTPKTAALAEASFDLLWTMSEGASDSVLKQATKINKRQAGRSD